jgi:phosphoribosylglycinamide formyltransferase 1
MSHDSRPRLAILISGGGSNMAAIARACQNNVIAATVGIVIADRPQAGGLAAAAALGLTTAVVPWQTLSLHAQAEPALQQTLRAAEPDYILLAGFMRILSTDFVVSYLGRMLNIHPSLLPAYPGLHTHQRVLTAGDSQHGASVHFVIPELDAGPVVLQSRLTVRPEDTPQSLAQRVLTTEHVIYPRVVDWLTSGRLCWRESQPWLDDQPLRQPLVEDFRGS